MRKNKIIIMVLGVSFIVGVIVVMFFIDKLSNLKSSDVGVFRLSEYQWEIENFPSDKNVGQVHNSKVAIERAKELWLEEYSIINGQHYNPINGRKIEVSFDFTNECWHINGTLPSNVDGAVPHALIQKNGKVLALWMG